ncbi:hypothetical protein DVH05_026140 [Phytophthora capsici]|nr:hypothetical protein DVH05_026140 [Phytophthora capsici]
MMSSEEMLCYGGHPRLKKALQHQMDSERKRCAVLLANEKTLLRDLQERNTAITKLQRTISALQQQVQDKTSSTCIQTTTASMPQENQC